MLASMVSAVFSEASVECARHVVLRVVCRRAYHLEMVSVDTSLLAGLAVGSVVTFLLVVFTLPVLEFLLARRYPVPTRSGAIVISGEWWVE